MYASDDLSAYRRARTTFSSKVYGLLILWLFLAIIQWLVVCLVEDARSIMKKFYYVSLIAFAVAVLLLTIFIFADGLRFMQFLNLIISIVIVELQIIATFILVALSWWADVLVFFVLTALVVLIFLLIGIVLPRKIDLTLDIAVLFIIAFIFLIIAVFAVTLLKNLWFSKMYTYLTVELAVTLTILLFVIYHAQTIHGNRFAEMRLNDFFLGSLILFHDFLIIFWLTFYWQIRYRPITPNSWMASSVTPHKALLLDDAPKAWDVIPLGNVFTEPIWDDGKSQTYSGSIEDQEEDGSQNRQITKKRVTLSWDTTSRGTDRRNQKKPGSMTTTPLDWAVFKPKTTATTESNDQDEPVEQIQRNLEAGTDYKSRGVLYKVKPIYGGNLPPQEDDTDTEKSGMSTVRINLGSESKDGYAKGKPIAGYGNPSGDFSLGDPPRLNPRREWNEYFYKKDGQRQLPAEKPIILGDKIHGFNKTAPPKTYREVLEQRELKSRGKEKSIANPEAKSSHHSTQRLPDFRKLVMNNTSVAD